MAKGGGAARPAYNGYGPQGQQQGQCGAPQPGGPPQAAPPQMGAPQQLGAAPWGGATPMGAPQQLGAPPWGSAFPVLSRQYLSPQAGQQTPQIAPQPPVGMAPGGVMANSSPFGRVAQESIGMRPPNGLLGYFGGSKW